MAGERLGICIHRDRDPVFDGMTICLSVRLLLLLLCTIDYTVSSLYTVTILHPSCLYYPPGLDPRMQHVFAVISIVLTLFRHQDCLDLSTTRVSSGPRVPSLVAASALE